MTDQSTLLVLSQVYVPDPAAVGQYLADACAEMVRRGHRVVVVTADRGYDDPTERYPRREVIDGVEVRRVRFSSLGKKSIAVRLLAGLAFVMQAIGIGLTTRGINAILVSTTPPVAPLGAVAVGALRRVPITYWVMDLNPDQMVALGRIQPGSVPARGFDLINRAILRRASAVVVLDRFMAERVNAKVPIPDKVVVIPPWAYAEQLAPVARATNPFRREQGWSDETTVVMYSGNHGLSTPVTTILEAALAMADRSDLVFAFIGGGIGKREVDEAVERLRPPNVVSLPYQPFERTRYSLSAADVHLVTVGDAVVGVVHPSKLYGAMAVSRPVLYMGPSPSHVTDLLDETEFGWSIRHGDVAGAVRTLDRIRLTSRSDLDRMGRNGRQLIEERYSYALLRDRFCDLLEAKVAGG